MHWCMCGTVHYNNVNSNSTDATAAEYDLQGYLSGL